MHATGLFCTVVAQSTCVTDERTDGQLFRTQSNSGNAKSSDMNHSVNKTTNLRLKPRMENDIAVVGYGECVAVHSKLQNKEIPARYKDKAKPLLFLLFH